jgi:hypothetical protein
VALFEERDARAHALIAAAAVALHADIAHRGLPTGPGAGQEMIPRIGAAFDTAECFLVEAERRAATVP